MYKPRWVGRAEWGCMVELSPSQRIHREAVAPLFIVHIWGEASISISICKERIHCLTS